MTHTYGSVVTEAFTSKLQKLFLETVDVSDTTASEEAVLDSIIKEFALVNVHGELAVLRLAVGNGHIKCGNSASWMKAARR